METKPNIRDEQQFELVLKTMARDKSPGPDNITMGWIKYLDQRNRRIFLKLPSNLWETGSLPDEVTEARVASIYKNSDRRLQENHRLVSLLNCFYKLVAAIIKMRLEEGLEHRISRTQFGFRK